MSTCHRGCRCRRGEKDRILSQTIPKVPDFGGFRATRLNRAYIQPPLCILWHMPPINSAFLLLFLIHHLPSCCITPLYLIRPESETTITFHQRHSQYLSRHLQSRTEDIGAWASGCWRYSGSVCTQTVWETTDMDGGSVRCSLRSRFGSQHLKYGCLKLRAIPSYHHSCVVFEALLFFPGVNNLTIALLAPMTTVLNLPPSTRGLRVRNKQTVCTNPEAVTAPHCFHIFLLNAA